MAKIKIKDLPRDYKITEDEMKRIRGGVVLTSSLLKPASLETSSSLTDKTFSDMNLFKW